MNAFWQGRKILVTGATRGIGAELTRQLMSKGARVIAVARNQSQLDQMQDHFRNLVDVLAADLSDPEMPRAVVNWVSDAHPDCSAVFNNAAVMTYPVLTTPARSHLPNIAAEVQINLAAPMQICAGLLPVLADHPEAQIINITSGLALAPKAEAPFYCATKAALRSFTRTLRYQIEDAALPIRVTEALPPVVDTTLSRGRPEKKMSPAETAHHILKGVADRRSEVWIGKARLLPPLMRLSPRLCFGLMRNMQA